MRGYDLHRADVAEADDRAADLQAGRSAGVRPILGLTGEGNGTDAAGADFVAKDFSEAARFVLGASEL